MPGVPVNVALGGHLIEVGVWPITLGVSGHTESIAKKGVADMVTGRAFVSNAKLGSRDSRHSPSPANCDRRTQIFSLFTT